MKELLRQIYDDLANGRLSQQKALERVRALKLDRQGRSGTLFMRPVWQPSPLAAAARATYERRHIVVVDLPGVDVGQLPDGQCIAVSTDRQKNLAERYTDAALQAFQVIQDILQQRRRGQVLVQIVVADDLFAGLSGLLRTASLENPQVAGQLILVAPDLSTEEASRLLQNEHALDAVVRYQNGERHVLRWDELPEIAEEAPVAFQDGGVYLITGGAGRLAGLFAREIVERTTARVVLTSRSPWTGETLGDRVSYRQADVADGEQVTNLIASVGNDYGRLDGILHCAGIIADNFILKKNGDELARVLAPKVAGTFHLDHATRDLDLDFFVLFSSVSAAAGSIGQADYATANAFMDRFSAWRNEQVAAGRRHGRTRSINWSWWEEGGMDADEASSERLGQTTGMQPMATATGIRAFHRCLALPWDQVGVAEGDFARLRVAWFSGRLIEQERASVPAPPVSSVPIERSTFVEKAREFLRNECAHVLGLQPRRIDPQAPLEDYGIDSILAVRLTTHLERTFGPLAKTLFFEYGTIAELTGYFLESHSARLEAVLAGSNEETQTAETPRVERKPLERRSSRRSDRVRAAVPAPTQPREADPIAIIGLSGRYPEAVDIDAYWRNLRDGKDCIIEVPKERWDWKQYFSDDRTKSGHHYSKWGGFITGVDEFDPLFFNISPKEAKYLDPQERLFLQHAWMAIEDAGYTRAALQIADADDLPGQVGVYAGVMYTEYQLFGAEGAALGKRIGMAASMASIANRVSYSLNLHGPSVTLDTMCSSSLTAIHFACLDLKQGRTSLAIAGGVNVTVHPNKYLVLSGGQFISSDGHCQSFGEGGDGYIPGEGVGVVILKRLSDAERDGDHIYGVIRASSLNHGGKTNGYTVPNLQAQASVIRRALLESGIDARHISYIEAHGTGTKLGDPIEIAALSKAFAKSTQDTGFCLLGSAKSNIGHCESAAGIAGLTKVLLQMQHRQIVPSLHSEQLNPNIDFERTPFIVNQTLRPWEQPVIDGRPVPRIAGLSSFGAGGSNAHILIEEYQAPAVQPMAFRDVAIVLSARTADQLRQRAQDLLDSVRTREAIDLAAIAYTLQVGREAMDERLGFVVSSAGQLIAKLEAWLAGEREDSYQGQVRRDKASVSLFSTDASLQQTVETWIANSELAKLVELWAKGLELDWAKLYGGMPPQRISLPTYPFAKERYWIDIEATPVVGAATAVLHPLLHRNTSDLTQQSYSSRFKEPLSAPAYLEMARAAVQDAAGAPREAAVELREVRWAHPLPVAQELSVALLPDGRDDLRFEIYSRGADEEFVHCQGRAALICDAIQLREPSGELLTRLRLPEISPDYVVNPALIDDALRAAAGEQVPVAIESLRILSPCTAEMAVWVRRSPGERLAIDLCDERGNVCAQLRGVTFDAPATEVVETPVAVRTRREIPLTAVERKKRGAIALSAPGTVVAAERLPDKARLTLSNTVVGAPSAVSSVKVYDDGDGVFSIEISQASDGITPLRQALDIVQAEASAKVLLLRGLEHASLDYNEAVEQKLFEAIVSFPYPTIALLHGDAGGAAFMAAALCDFVVCDEDATYASPDPSIPALTLFSERFGDLLAQDFLYRTTSATGRELRAKGWTCAILPAEQLEAHAQTLALALTAKSQEALGLLKQHLVRSLVDRVAALTPVEPTESATAAACEVLVLSDDLPEDALPRLQQRIVESEVPVVAALTGNAKGDVWLVAQSCDACVYSRQGVYSAAGIGEAGAGVFAYRLGNEAAREILLSGVDYSGSDLEQRVVGLIAVDGDRVVATAEDVAASWARLPRTALAAWKRHSAAVLQEKISSAASPDQLEPAAEPIELQSKVVTVTPHANGVVVVKMEEREARNMFSGDLVAGLNEAFAHIAHTPAYKVVVLTGYDTYFAAGGTKESLLAIQAGKIRFTDQKIFQLPLDCRLPVIAAMQGHGLGAGWALGMFADVALLSEESRYVSPYMNYGFTPGAGATWILADKMGQDLARESLLTAQAHTGRELKARGLRLPVLRRADVLPAAMALAGRMAQASGERLIALKRQLTAYVHQPLEETYQRELAMHDRTFVGQADTAEKIRFDFYPDIAEVAPAPAVPVVASGSDAVRSIAAAVRTLLAAELQMNEDDVDDDVQFVDLGLDSIGGVSLLRKVNEKYGTSIEATKIYSYPTLAQLARYVKEQAEQGRAGRGPAGPPAAGRTGEPPVDRPAGSRRAVLTSWRSGTASRLVGGSSASRPPAIAIIGMAGQFPQARNLDEFWQNLTEGKNCITQVSADRWDLQTYYQPDAIVPGKTNSPYMGALDEYDRFDPLFFNISPTEAENMDPQQRLFLQSCWHTIEHAGYDARSLSGTKCGVFVGCAASDYHDRSQLDQLSAHGFTGGATSILAARISYFLNLQGPCVAIDTACSSSLVAIAQACDNLNAGGSDVALAGGVYVMASPAMHVMTAQAGMLSPEGKCFTFDQRADGFVPGEGVGVVMLKRLADAERDGDVIYGVIEGWGINQDGKTNGITAPNPESQTRLEQEVYDRHGIDPSSIQLIEAHGTGTKLGDPIEIEGLQNAFGKYTTNRQYCALGSVKSNIGHCLTAAGIAGVIKLLLAIEHKKLPPTINFERLNEHIDLADSPFYVNTSLQEWELHGAPRRMAGISSFGFSGTNAHLVIGESEWPVHASRLAFAAPFCVPLSARTPEQLREKASDLLSFLRKSPSVELADLAYTLQAGRTPMDERLGFVVSSLDQLADRLQAWLDGAAYIQDCQQGRVKRGTESPAAGADHKPSKLLELWVRGADLDWNRFYGDDRPRRIALPVYPFAKERYWLEPAPVATPTSALHPLLHANASDFSQQSYSATFTGKEFFLAHHQVRSDRGTVHKFLPGAAYLEMTRAAIQHALPQQPEARVLELRNFVWAQPVIVADRKEVRIALITDDADEIEYEIYSRAGDEEVVHAQGRAVLTSRSVPPALDLAQLESAMTRGRLERAGIYATFARMGLMYGPTFQAVTSIRRGSDQALAYLRLPEGVEGEYVLHPSLMDGAIQACLGLLDSADTVTEPRVPFALDALRVFAPCTRDMLAWVRSSAGSTTKLDIDLCDASGNVAVQLLGFTLRAVAQPQPAGRLYATPVWRVSDAISAGETGYAEHHVVMCEPGVTDTARLRMLLPHCHVAVLDAQQQNIAERYTAHALACFERIENILRRRPQSRVLFQVVVPDALFAGLSALLKTAALENPQFAGQVIVADLLADDLAVRLQNENARDAVVRYAAGSREVLQWQEIPAGDDAPPIAFRDSGVYLITGGLGALGTLFATEILGRTSQARVVLTGRAPLTAETQSARVSYRQAEVTDLEQVTRLIASIRDEYGRLDGILHCAGAIADNFILKKSGAEFRQVLAPKVAGTFNLDQASRDIDLDFFVLFSSVAGAAGNLGQADYAAANAFMDGFAAWRNLQVPAKTRSGRTRSINWPLWLAGRMSLDPAKLELVQQTTGVRPMQTATGIDAFYRCFALPYDQVLVVEGDLARLRRVVLAGGVTALGVTADAPKPQQPLQPAPVASGSFAERAQELLRKELSGLLKLPSHKLDPQAPLETYGIDSILAMKLTSRLEQTFGSLPKTLFFEYQTLGELATYFASSHSARLATLFAGDGAGRAESVETRPDTPMERKLVARRRFSGTRTAGRIAGTDHEPIAVIGLSGRYPEAVDLDAYWRNLRDGRDCITEVPKERWDWREYFTDDRAEGGGHYSKWGGFIAGVDEFDPLFFNISPREAKIIDPQERLFLQHTWMAIEDAGYTRATLQAPDAHDLPGQAGVYVGVMYVEYQMFGAAALAQGKRIGVPGSMASIANRVSYVLNLHGPSMTLDTMCSSSLTAIHLACQDLRAGRTSLGVAGGVNVSIHPNKYFVLSAGQFISSDGHCQSFGEGGDGYIPGEGVGVVVLKRLSDAKRDGDHIYGIIRGSALNHGGRTNGYTVPNPQAQASVIRRALTESGVDARHISYIEAHGTGTKLGDPIEIAALSKAFGIQDNGFCLIGSAKSNIGHAESAAGIAGLTKVLLQMQHRQIVPSLHSAQLNPLIEFEKTPFVVNQSLRPWEQPVIDGRPVPRIAGISSFGAGGANAHMIVEEYQAGAVQVPITDAVIVLSARTAEQLRQKAQDLLELVRSRESTIDLAAVAYTLQVGREAMDERLGCVVRSAEELLAKLEAWVAGRQDIEDLHQGQVKRNREALSLFSTDTDLQQAVEKWIENRKIGKLLELWVKGLEVDWSRLYGETKPPRTSLPTYPFAKERYWVDIEAAQSVAARPAPEAMLHPLLHRNASDLREQRYRSTFTGDEFFVADTGAQKVVPAVVCLEMARAAVRHALPEMPEAGIELHDVDWAQPIVAGDGREIAISLFANGEDEVEYEIYGDGADEDGVHCRGRAAVSRGPAPAALDLAQLERQMTRGNAGADGGPSSRAVRSIRLGDGQLLAHLQLPAGMENTAAGYVLHPSLLEGAMQACVALVDASGRPVRLPLSMASMRIASPTSAEMVAWVRSSPRSEAGDVAFDVDLCDTRGNVCAQMRGVAGQRIAADEVEQSIVRAASPVAAVPRERKEIAFLASQQAPAVRRTAGISLAVPGASVPVQAPAAPRASVALPNAVASAAPSASAVRLYDDGNGMFAMEAGAAPARDAVAHLRRALEVAQQQDGLKVLMIRGVERCFARGGSADFNEALEQGLYPAVASFPYPVIAVADRDAVGAAFVFDALCDFMVCGGEVTYGYGLEPSIPMLELFSERFGDTLAQELLYQAGTATGAQLRAKGWTGPLVPAADAGAFAEELASSLAEKSRDALRLLKQHLTRRLVDRVAALTRTDAATEEAAESGPVLVVEFAKADLRQVLDEAGDARAIVLVGDDAGFVGATPEVERLLLDAQIPVVAAFPGNARGSAWGIAQFCDAVVHAAEGVYSAAGVGPLAAALFVHRFGNDAAEEILLTGADYRGADLRGRVPAAIVAESDEVQVTAVKIAESWARLPRAVLTSWKSHSVARIREKTGSLPVAWEPGEDEPAQKLAAPAPIALRSRAVHATVHPGGIVVVTMEDRDAKNAFSDALIQGLTEVFAHIEETPGYKAVVLTGYDRYFASGGTKESLLAIEAGKAKFTDTRIFQSALDCRLPVIAAMQGHAIGAGWSLGMFADVALLSEESRYVSPYMDYGFTPGAGATSILGDRIGQDVARESLLTARPYTGRALRERALLLRALPRAEVLAAALALAGQIAQQPRHRVIALKQQLTEDVHRSLEETYRLELAMHEQTFVGRSDTLARIEKNFHDESDAAPAAAPQIAAPPADARADADVLPAVIARLKTLLANELLMNESDIDEDAQFVDLGLDSISSVAWLRKINESYQTSIEATKVYSYPTLAQLSRLIKEEAEKHGTLSRAAASPAPATPTPSAKPEAPIVRAAGRRIARRARGSSRAVSGGAASRAVEKIAIIGMAGQFPQARNLDEFWLNLAEGRNCITQVPASRWDLLSYYQPGAAVAGKTYCQWMGALDEQDRFDPIFFNISPTEAAYMDPQQRLFLQSCWHTIEHAGYDARALSGTKCGVFVGCASGEYHAGTQADQLNAHGFTGGATSILAGRVSYFLNLQGPCVAIDTACSSSLVAIAQACDSLNTGASDVALAGGVYVMAGPGMHIMTSQAGMLSPEGKCFSFDQRANGFVPGEAVGAVMLKRLSDAERDGDIIYGVLEGWGVNQDGRTNGITAPNPESQTRLEQEIYDRYGIDPTHIQLIEAHGTGTKLGDPIEVEGLQKAFGKYTQNKQYCALGTVKSNIGHCLTAAGVAGVIKLLLALEHEQLPPTINFERLNEHIDLTESPFFVNTRLEEWELHGAPRRLAGISSFGFSGTNAHLVIGEYDRRAEVARPVYVAPPTANVIVPLSARTADQLREKAGDLLSFIRKSPAADLAGIAYTLQTGRTPMDERIGFIVSSIGQLEERLQAYVDGARAIEGSWRGQVKRTRDALSLFNTDSDLQDTIDRWVANGRLARLVDLWVSGIEIDWRKLYGEVKPRRVALPGYPFAKERYWITPEAPEQKHAATLHPLLHENASDLSGQRYRSTFSGTELFLADRVLPPAACLEMVRAAVQHASPAESAVLELHDTVWGEPFIANAGNPVSVALLANDGEGIAYEVYSHGADREIVHCQGRAIVTTEPRPAALDLAQLEARMAQQKLAPANAAVTTVWRRNGELLAQLRLPENAAPTAGEYVLHPSVVQGAFEAALLLSDGGSALALHTLRVFAPCTPKMFAWARSLAADGSVDVDLCDERGNVCVQVHGLSSPHVAAATERHEPVGTVLAAPVWKTRDLERPRSAAEFAEHHVVLCGLPDIDAARLGASTLSLETDGQTDLARRYTEHALASFERIQAILQSKPPGRVLFQIVIRDREDDAPLTGLSALVKTAGQEHPYFTGQVLLVPQDITAEELAVYLEDEKTGGLDSLVRYERGVRQVLRWSELPADPAPAPIAFKEHGVYLITGGTGALGVVFAKEILAQREATVVLTGRSSMTKETQDLLDELSAHGGRVSYRQLDLTDLDQVIDVIAGIEDESGPLTGILHCAGMAADEFIVRKTSGDLARVLAPKVTGTFQLDEATKDIQLDFFVLFSSVAGVLGNAGQADYAAANAFLDRFAARRNRQVDASQRHGRTRSINWPLWQAGGMRLDAAARERLKEAAGLLPMQTATGMQAFHRSLASPHDQLLVLEGMPAKIAAYLQKVRAFEAPERPVEAQLEAPPSGEQLQQDVKAILAAVLKVDGATIDVDQPFVEFGLDSFLGAELMASINRKFGTELAHIVVFDHPTVRELSGFLEKQLSTSPRQRIQPPPAPPMTASGAYPILKKRIRAARTAARQDTAREERIAIIGMSGRYPQANDLNEYWSHLAAGRNCVTEVPASRWDVRRHYDPDRTRKDTTYSKWLGAIEDVDCFDPLFFRISPNEAEHIDPQHRLFLQESYRAFEDAGYSPDALANKKGGVYLGISTNEYASLLTRNRALSAPVTSNSSAIAAARIAYYLNLKGPAIAIDTACSSALVAIHLACQAISRGEIDFALAGGVTLWLAPESYVAMSQAGMFSPNGQCKTFDDSADGIVNGDGVGAVVLKRLEDAERDGDFIYGVILGSGINQDGKTNGITAPSVASQIDLERGIYAKYGIDPETITYVEAHGTGTKLGDPIELEALATVFREKTDKKRFCALGSVKSNIGHTTSAAGVAGVHKVLLSMQHRTLVPTLNVTKETTRFDFGNSPFYLSKETQPWNVAPGSLRRAAVSSFGFSGTNAHLVLEEYEAPAAPAVPRGDSPAFIVPLSARTPEQLRQRARDLLEHLRMSERPLDLAAVAYTLQTGREAMEERLGFVVSSVEQLAERLRAFVDGEKNIEGFCRGRVDPGGESMALGRDDDMQEAIGKWIARRKLPKLLDLWVRGVSFDWNELCDGVRPRRVSLPGYPFRKDRCWIDVTPPAAMLDIRLEAGDTMKSIDDIIDQIGADMIETEQAVAALKMLV